MKVICINSKIHITKSGLVNNASDYLIEGEVYTVLDIIENNIGEMGYILKEVLSPSKKGSFSVHRFIICSNQDETILINNKQDYYEPVILR